MVGAFGPAGSLDLFQSGRLLGMPGSNAAPSSSLGSTSRTPFVPLTPEEQAGHQRRTVQVLFIGQVMASASVPAAITVAARIAKDLLGGDTFAGSASAITTLGAAACAVPLSRLMRRQGRRVGMQLGYLLAFLGAIVAITGAQHRWFPLFLFGCFFFGFGQGTNQIARFAAADLATPDTRGRAISTLVFGSTFGGVMGPSLANWAQGIAGKIGLWRLTGPFILAAVLLGLAAIHTFVRLRPDPLILSGATQNLDGTPLPKAPPVRQALGVIRSFANARMALIALTISQVTMVSVMTMTPVHMAEHGNDGRLGGYVIALHVFGMYGFSILIGRSSDKFGRLPMLTIGALVLMLATIVSALAGYRPSMLFAGLFLLGVGWSFSMVSASALLTESVPLESRVNVQGSADLIISLMGATAAFSSGFVKRAFGFHTLANVGTLLAFGLLLMTMSLKRAQSQPVQPA